MVRSMTHTSSVINYLADRNKSLVTSVCSKNSYSVHVCSINRLTWHVIILVHSYKILHIVAYVALIQNVYCITCIYSKITKTRNIQ
jgi:hypothetical protein